MQPERKILSKWHFCFGENKYSLMMRSIKIKSPVKFYGMNKTFLWVDLSLFNQLLLWRYYNDKKLDTGYWRHYHSRCRPPRSHVHTMSNELKLRISCNIFLALKLISMMRSGHNISHYSTARLSIHVWNHDLIWWQNKIDAQKHFHKNMITSS